MQPARVRRIGYQWFDLENIRKSQLINAPPAAIKHRVARKQPLKILNT
jgi:hypothetical protein